MNLHQIADMSRTSLIFYSGIEGIGGLEMETYGDENVGCNF